VTFALDQALAASAGTEDAQLTGLLDRTRIGVGGHSAGASTALQVAGGDHRFSAVLALAPGSNPPTDSAVPNILVPIMMMTGGLDNQHPPYQQQHLLSLLPATGPERWQVVLPRGGHSAFANNCRGAGCGPDDLPQTKAHDLINRWATMFLQVRVSLDDQYLPFLDSMLAGEDPDVDITRIQGP
jgi:dienelactone hydrolase